jgi:hypothetical protein
MEEKQPEAKKQTLVARIRQHRIALTKILRDDRLSPNRRLLAFCLALWLDAEHAAGQEFVQNLVKAVWVTPERWRWTGPGDREDGKNDDPQSVLEQQTVRRMKGVFDDLLNAEAARQEVPEPPEVEG